MNLFGRIRAVQKFGTRWATLCGGSASLYKLRVNRCCVLNSANRPWPYRDSAFLVALHGAQISARPRPRRARRGRTETQPTRQFSGVVSNDACGARRVVPGARPGRLLPVRLADPDLEVRQRATCADSGHSSGTSALHSPVTKRLATSESTKPSLTQ